MSSAGDDEEGMGTGGEIRRQSPDSRLEVEVPARRSRMLREWVRKVLGTGTRGSGPVDPARPESGAVTPTPTLGPGDPRGGESGYTVYGDFVKDELEAQEKRKASFEQRGLAVITTSGALVTLLFALAALSTRESATFTLPDSARTWLSLALVLFFISAMAALISNLPLIYQAARPDKMRERLREKPVRDAAAAARDVAFTRLDALESAKRLNGFKGWVLASAMLFEALAVGCVAAAISIIL